jgi:hypothetical protein
LNSRSLKVLLLDAAVASDLFQPLTQLKAVLLSRHPRPHPAFYALAARSDIRDNVLFAHINLQHNGLQHESIKELLRVRQHCRCGAPANRGAHGSLNNATR